MPFLPALTYSCPIKYETIIKYDSCHSKIKLFIKRNLDNWVALFDEDHRERLPVLKMYLTFENQCVKFFPGYEDLEELILFVAKTITESMLKVH